MIAMSLRKDDLRTQTARQTNNEQMSAGASWEATPTAHLAQGGRRATCHQDEKDT